MINPDAPLAQVSTSVTRLVPDRTAHFLAFRAARIRQLCKQTGENIVEIGRALAQCHEHLNHGEWLAWLEREFGWSDQTARNYMRVYEMSKSKNFLDLSLPVSALYLLAAPSTPEKARAEIQERAKKGEIIPLATVKNTIKQHRRTPAQCRIDRFENAIQTICTLCENIAEIDIPPLDAAKKLAALQALRDAQKHLVALMKRIGKGQA